ncbi:MAG TPA: GldG family protein [Acidimicrobiales bacterium]|nr:GldG family protein [Acidimicrobiales bacterium]
MIRRFLATAVALVAVVALTLLAGAVGGTVDLTAERTNSLTAQTGQVLDALDRQVRITAFVRRNEPGRVEAVTRLQRYGARSPHVEGRVLDPDEAPGERQRLGVDPFLGGVAIELGDRVEVVPTAGEQDLTSGIARLVRGREVRVCVTAGHGEPGMRATLGGPALGRAAGLLEAEGYTVATIDLLADPEVPEECTVVVLASPTEPLGDALDALVTWVDADGRLLVLLDPLSGLELSPLLAPYGLGIERGIVFEGDPEAVLGGDVTAPIVRSYSGSHPIPRRLPPTYLPGVQEVVVDDEDGAEGLTVTGLAETSPLSYLEREPLAAEFDPATDRPGPVTVAAAADRSRNVAGDVRRSRIVVVGDIDFATDAFVEQAANGSLLSRSVGWLAEDEELVALSANLPVDRPLGLTDARVASARFLGLVVIPGVFLLVGGMVWALRRPR